MNRITIILGFALSWLSLIPLNAQQVLTLSEAIQTALTSNYDIRVSRYDTEIAAMQVDPALVGRRPEVVLTGNYELGWSDTYAEVLSLGGESNENLELDLDGISNDVILGLEFRMNLLDGRAGRYRLDQLQAASLLSRLQLQQTIEQTAYDVTVAYLEMARQQSLLDITQRSISLNQNRLDRVAEDAEFGVATSLDRLQIEVDLKTDSSSLRNLELELDNARRNLNFLMGFDNEESYMVETEINLNTALQYGELESAMLARNSFLQLQDQNITIADLDLELSKAAFRPTLQGYANVNFAYLQDQANFLQINRAVGPNVGLRFTYQITDWGGRRIKREAANLTVQQRQLERTQLEDQLVRDLSNAYAIYRNTLEQLRIEESNLELFAQNLENMQNMFELGTATNTDVRAAQLNFNAAQNRVKNFQYTIKQAEVALYLLSGELTQ